MPWLKAWGISRDLHSRVCRGQITKSDSPDSKEQKWQLRYICQSERVSAVGKLKDGDPIPNTYYRRQSQVDEAMGRCVCEAVYVLTREAFAACPALITIRVSQEGNTSFISPQFPDEGINSSNALFLRH